MRASSSEIFSTIGSSTSYSSWISPTISSIRSSIVTRPAVPPYSSSTIAMCTLRRWSMCSRSSTEIDSGTKSGVRSSVRMSNCSSLRQDRQQVLGVEDADDVVDRLLVDRDARVARDDDRVDDLVERRVLGECRDVDARHHHLVHALLAQLEHRADHLLLFGLDDALLAAALDEDQQLLGGDLLVLRSGDAEQARDGVA